MVRAPWMAVTDDLGEEDAEALVGAGEAPAAVGDRVVEVAQGLGRAPTGRGGEADALIAGIDTVDVAGVLAGGAASAPSRPPSSRRRWRRRAPDVAGGHG